MWWVVSEAAAGPVPGMSTGARSADAADAFSMLRWGLRTYAWLVLLAVAAVGVGLPMYQASKPVRYTANALVVAVDLQTDLKALPRFGASVFDQGAVARVVDERFGDDNDPEDVVPRVVSLVTEQDSISMKVQGHASTPEEAADRADVAAAEFVRQLNRAGTGVGTFAQQGDAPVPVEPDDVLRAGPHAVALGVAGGLILGLGLVTLLLVARRPVLEGAERAGGLPVVGTVTIPPSSRRMSARAESVRGLAPLCRGVLDSNARAVLFTGPPALEPERTFLAAAVAVALGRVTSVGYFADRAPGREYAIRRQYDGVAWVPDADADDASPAITVVDGVKPLDLIVVEPDTATLLIVPVGLGLSQLRALIADCADARASLVLVHLPGSRRRWRRRVTPVAAVPSPPPPAAEPAKSDSPEPTARSSAG